MDYKKKTYAIIGGIMGVIGVGLIAAIIVVLAGKGKAGKTTETAPVILQTEAQAAAQTEAQTQAQTEAVPVDSDVPETEAPAADMSAAFDKLAGKIVEAGLAGDRAAMSALLVDSAAHEDRVDYLLNEMLQQYASTTTRILYEADDCGWGFIYQSSCAGTYPDTSAHYHFLVVPVSWQGGQLLLDYSESCINTLSSYQLPFPEGFFAALDAGRNGARFGGDDASWTDNKIVIDGALDVNSYAAWQNEDGSVDIFCCAKNGTSATRAVKSTKIVITDKDSGHTILSVTENEAHFVEPGYSITYLVHVTADEVQNGTARWGDNLHLEIDTTNR